MIDQADLDELYRRYSTPALRDEAREKLRYALYHGNDSPLGPEGLIKVAALFNLGGQCRFMFDEHERMISGQPEALSRRLGVDLGIKGVELSSLDWDDEPTWP